MKCLLFEYLLVTGLFISIYSLSLIYILFLLHVTHLLRNTQNMKITVKRNKLQQKILIAEEIATGKGNVTEKIFALHAYLTLFQLNTGPAIDTLAKSQ
jgi:hypothetical protein